MDLRNKLSVMMGLSVILVLFQACGGSDSSPGTVQAQQVGFSFQSIMSKTIQPRCVSCHNGANASGGVDLSNYNAIMNTGSVVAGDSGQSTLFLEVAMGTMPPGNPLNAQEISDIETWINNGATNDVINTGQRPPMVDAGPNMSDELPVTEITIQGSALGLDGNLTYIEWTQISGPNTATLNDRLSFNLRVSNLAAGNYVFQFEATDTNGQKSNDVMNLSISAQVLAPMANAGPDQTLILPTNSVTLNGSGTDPDGMVVSYLWIQAAGPGTATLAGANTPNLTASDLIAGVYTFELRVTDDVGAVGTDRVSVTVFSEEPTYTLLKAQIFDNQCLNCHSGATPAGNYGMDDYTLTVTRGTAGNPDVSPLFIRVDDDSMPMNGTPLTPLQKAQIRRWIQQGALDN